MTATTPLLAILYPLGSDLPDGASQMETIAKALEKYAVIPVLSQAARDNTITAGLRHDGTMAWITGTDELQVYTGSAWQTVYTGGDKPVRLGADLPNAANYPNGGIFVRSGGDPAAFFCTGSGWTRLTDMNDLQNQLGHGTVDGVTVTTTDVNGASNPSGGGAVFTTVKVPESGRILVTVSAMMKCASNTESAYFGYEVREDTNTNPGTWFGFNKQRSGRVSDSQFQSSGWTSIINVGHVGSQCRVYGMHAVSNANQAGTFMQREVVAIPVR